MIISLAAQIADWKYGRNIILKLINGLSDENLDKKLPRNKLNTIRLQIEEIAVIQGNYVDALTTKEINFSWQPLKDTSKQGLIRPLAKIEKI